MTFQEYDSISPLFSGVCPEYIMLPRSLPTELNEAVRKACEHQELDYDEAIEAISNVVIGEVLVYNVWHGPGPENPDLLLDVFVLTSHGLFAHEAHKDGAYTICTFLDAISEIVLAKENEPLARYSIIISRYEITETARIYSNDEDLQGLMDFHRKLIQARLEYANTKASKKDH